MITKRKGIKSLLLIMFFVSILIIITGVVLLLFNNNDKTNKNDSKTPETTKDYRYYMYNYNEKKYEFKSLTKSSNIGKIEEQEQKDSMKITYSFEIIDGSVFVSTSLNEEKFKFSEITNAKELLIFDLEDENEKDAVMVVTKDNNLYIIRLYDITTSSVKLITDFSNTKYYVETYKLMSDVQSIEFGDYILKDKKDIEKVALFNLSNNQKIVLTSSKIINNISNDNDLENPYIKSNNKDALFVNSLAISNIYNHYNELKSGKVKDMSNSQIINMTILYLNGSRDTCFDKSYLENKAQEIFDVKINNKKLPKNVIYKDGKYCTTDIYNTNHEYSKLQISNTTIKEENNKVLYDNQFSYENEKLTIRLEYELKKDHYVLISVSKN